MDNPWMGPSSYEEPKASDKQEYKFCGRDNATWELTSLINDNLYVTLYGRSGIGKTSLLNAGVFPKLRAMGYLPVVVRFSQMLDDFRETPAAYLIYQIQKELAPNKDDVTAKGVLELCDWNEIDALWAYFSTHKFEINGKTTYPAIVLDQFEEIFSVRKTLITAGENDMVELLMKQLYSLTDDNKSYPDGYHEANNFRLIFSIREDYLYTLEDCIDKYFLTKYKYNRYRLKAPSKEEGTEIITGPGEELLPKEDEEKGKIVAKIISNAKYKDDGNISPFMLSLICSELFKKALAVNEPSPKIDTSMIPVNGENILRDFYLGVIKDLSHEEREHLEDDLVDSNRMRNSVNIGMMNRRCPSWHSLLEGSNHILQEVNGKVELVHDMLAGAIFDIREKRREEQRLTELKKEKEKIKKKSVLRLILLSCIVVFAIGIASFIYFQNKKIARNECNVILTNVNLLIGEGKLTEAANNLSLVIKRICSEGDEDMLSKLHATLYRLHDEYSGAGDYAVIKAHEGGVCDLGFNSDGTMLATCSNDQTVKIWNTSNGKLITQFTLTGDVRNIWSNNQIKNYFDDYDNAHPYKDSSTYKAYGSISTGCVVGKRRDISVPQMKYGLTEISPDGVYVANIYKDTIKIYKNSNIINSFFIQSHDNIQYIEFSYDNSRILIYCQKDNIVESYVVEYDLNGQLLREYNFYTDEDYVNTHSCIYIPYTYNILYIDYYKGIRYIDSNSEPHDYRYPSSDIEVFAASPRRHIYAIGKSDGQLILGHQLKEENVYNSDREDSAFFRQIFKEYIASGFPIVTDKLTGSNKELIEDAESYTAIFASSPNSYIALTGHRNHISHAIYNYSRTKIITRSLDQTIRFWDPKSGKEYKSMRLNVGGYGTQSITCSPDDHYLVSSSDECIYVWDIITGLLIHTVKVKNVNLSCFSSDGKRILFCYGDDVSYVNSIDFLSLNELCEWFFKWVSNNSQSTKDSQTEIEDKILTTKEVKVLLEKYYNNQGLNGKRANGTKPDNHEIIARKKDMLSWLNQLLKSYNEKGIVSISNYINDGTTFITETDTLIIKGGNKVSTTHIISSPKNKYVTLTENKEQYIKRLSKVLRAGSKIDYSDISIEISEIDANLFEVYYKQMFNAGKDDNFIESKMPGYVMLLVYWKEGSESPQMLIRTWQPVKHIKTDSDLYSSWDFDYSFDE